MAWIYDTYRTFKEEDIDAAGCVTGKPVNLNGIQGRTEATGRGVFYGLREACNNATDMKRLGMDLGIAGKRMVIQGLGNVGSYAGLISQEEGDVIIVGVGEAEGAIYNEKGIDLQKLLNHRKETGSILGFEGCTDYDKSQRDKCLEFDCDILVPAALENQLTGDNASRVKAKIIGEAANGPITSAGEDILLEKGVLIVPDLFLNAGGVTVSYFEWLKNLSHMRFGRLEKRFDQNTYDRLIDLVESKTGKTIGEQERRFVARGADEVDLVRSGLEETMINAYVQIRELQSRKRNVKDLRTAAFVNAIQKMGSDYLNMGVFP